MVILIVNLFLKVLFKFYTLKKFLDKVFRYLIISVVIFFFPIITVSSQKVINEYAKVIEIFNADSTDVDSMRVSEMVFEPEDTVLFIVMKGADVYTPANAPLNHQFWGSISNPNNTGIYNILLIYDISSDIVIFSTKLRKIKPLKSGEAAQLIRVKGGQDVYTVNEPLTCEPWDPVKGTGGVFALIAGKKIVLRDTIDVTGKGFNGGNPDTTMQKVRSVDYFKGKCSEAVDSFYTEGGVDSAGRKGESIVYNGFSFTRGMLYIASGGGGGNGKYSGGGGGGNYGPGEKAGKVSESCSPGAINLGGTGKDISGSYYNEGYFPNRIFMGGGGGTGTQNPDSGRYATKGGNGGGIIILITDTIEAIGPQAVISRGESVTGMATAGAGGGGGGGVIVVDANWFIGNPTFDVRGGNGGWTNHNDPTGPGGFGGGGVIWHSGNSITGITSYVNNGLAGQHLVAGNRGAIASSTQKGKQINNLKIPLSGFLFNVMPEDQDICEGATPVPFNASTPKGGFGPDTYHYRWLQSYDKKSWEHAPGPDSTKDDYSSGPQIDTIHFRRIVYSIFNSDTSFRDTSLILTINVLPRLENNEIAPDDVICFGDTIPEIKDDPVYNIKGGNGKYKYSWRLSTNMINWNTLTGKNDSILEDETPLQTTYYSRIVNSHVCWDTSNVVTMTVLPEITNNDILLRQPCCSG